MASIDEIEQRTGINFFPQVLDEAFEEVASRLWFGLGEPNGVKPMNALE